MNCEALRNCIDVLNRVRDAHSSQLEASVLAELDDVISQLMKLVESGQREVKLGTLSIRTLQVISQVVEVVVNITHLLK